MKISVITITYNSEVLISRNIESVHNQTLCSEQIFIDGASKDKTVEIIKSKMRPGDYLVSEPDGGIYDALNKGIHKATGDIIAILNSDDILSTGIAFEQIINSFKSGVELVYGGTQYLVSDTRRHSKIYLPSKFNGSGSFRSGWHPPHPSFYALRKCYLKSGGFNTKLKVAADFELMYRFFEIEKFSHSLIDEVLVKMHPDGFSSTWKNRFQGYKDINEAFKTHGSPVLFTYFIKRYLQKFLERSNLGRFYEK